MIGQRFTRNRKAADVGDGVASDTQLKEARSAELADEGAARGVDVGVVVWGEVGACPKFKLGSKIAVALVVKGPGKISHP